MGGSEPGEVSAAKDDEEKGEGGERIELEGTKEVEEGKGEEEEEEGEQGGVGGWWGGLQPIAGRAGRGEAENQLGGRL